MPGFYIGLALVSSAALLYEIALTRIFAIAQGYNFGFLVVSLALLGFGASGTVLALAPTWARRANRSSLGPLALVFSISLPGGYLIANYLPFDPYRIGWEPVQFGYLSIYLLVLAAPFLIAGMVQSLPLIFQPDQTTRLYAANLIGSGIGCLFGLEALDWSGETGAIIIASLAASCAALAFAFRSHLNADGARLLDWLIRWLSVAFIVLLTSFLPHPPTWFEVRLSPYKPLSQVLNYPNTRLIYRGWNAFSRMDVVDSTNIHSAPGLSLSFNGVLPRQTGVIIDAENIRALTSRENLGPSFLDALPIALPFHLRPNARALVIEPGGGLDVLVALNSGAESVQVVEQNPLMARLIQSQYPDRAGGIYAQPNVSVAISSGRGYVARNPERFDIVDLALSDNFRAVSAGAFTLSEDYIMTVQAYQSYLMRLAPDGLLVVQRWLQMPPTEEIRTAALVIAALEQSGFQDADQHIVAFRSFSTALILARREPFESSEIEQIKAFSQARQFDLVYLPGIQRSETNRFNVLQRDLYFESFQSLLANSTQFWTRYEYDVAPPTDDHPFFFQFFKWEQTPTVLALLGKTWQPFGGSGFLILIVLLGFALLTSGVLVALPLVVMRRKRDNEWRGGRTRPLVYFAALGSGFLFVEIPLIQRFTLFLDQPLYSFTVVIFGLLIFSGIGSLFAERLAWRTSLVALILVIGVYSLLLPKILEAFLGLDFSLRVLAAIVMLAPLGFLLGIPFPRGLHIMTRSSPDLIPLAWGINGFMSVVSSILSMLIAISWGLTLVLVGGALAYLLALTSIKRP